MCCKQGTKADELGLRSNLGLVSAGESERLVFKKKQYVTLFRAKSGVTPCCIKIFHLETHF